METYLESYPETELVETTVVVEPLPLRDGVDVLLSFIPVGFLLGFICLVLGLGISGIMKIFKRA